MPVDAMLLAAKDLKLLRVNSLRIGVEEERPYVSLGHDALANIALEWHEELKRSEAELKRSEAELKRREEDRRSFPQGGRGSSLGHAHGRCDNWRPAAWRSRRRIGRGGRGQRQWKATNAALELVAATKTRATDKDRYEKAIQNVEGLEEHRRGGRKGRRQSAESSRGKAGEVQNALENTVKDIGVEKTRRSRAEAKLESERRTLEFTIAEAQGRRMQYFHGPNDLDRDTSPHPTRRPAAPQWG